jgi:hypothetical protein
MPTTTMARRHLAQPTCTTNTHPPPTVAPTTPHRSMALPRTTNESDLSPGTESPVRVDPHRSMDTRPQWIQAPTRPGTMIMIPWSVHWNVIPHERPMVVPQQRTARIRMRTSTACPHHHPQCPSRSPRPPHRFISRNGLSHARLKPALLYPRSVGCPEAWTGTWNEA